MEHNLWGKLTSKFPRKSFNATIKNANSFIIGRSLISVGRFTYGHDLISIEQWNEGAPLSIGAFCSIASDVKIFLGGNHRVDWITTFPFGHIHESIFAGRDIVGHPSTNGGVSIGNDVWIGQGVTIMSGLTIGDGSVIAANSTVVKNVPPYSIVGGNPAQLIKFRFEKEIIELLMELKWWNLKVEVIKGLVHDLSQAPDPSKIRQWINIHCLNSHHPQE